MLLGPPTQLGVGLLDPASPRHALNIVKPSRSMSLRLAHTTNNSRARMSPPATPVFVIQSHLQLLVPYVPKSR